MITKVHTTKFAGYEFQYTTVTGLLTKTWPKFQGNHLGVMNALSKIESYVEYDPCPLQATDDGYHWYGLAKFKKDDGEIIILFPWLKNFESITKSSDRAVGIYASKEFSEEEILELVKNVSKALSGR